MIDFVAFFWLAVLFFVSATVIVLLICSLVKGRVTDTGRARAAKISFSAVSLVVFLICAGFLCYMLFFSPGKFRLTDDFKSFDEEEEKACIERMIENKETNGRPLYYFDVTEVEFLYDFDDVPRVFLVTYERMEEGRYGEKNIVTNYMLGFFYKERVYIAYNMYAAGWQENPFIRYGAQDKKKYYFDCDRYGYLNDDGKIIGVNGEWEGKIIPEEEYKNLKPYIVKVFGVEELEE